MIRGILPTAALLALAMAAPAANAHDEHCYYDFVMDFAGQVYVVTDAILYAGHFAYLVVYAEKNGHAGLQRGGADLLGTPDACQEYHAPDQAVVVSW